MTQSRRNYVHQKRRRIENDMFLQEYIIQKRKKHWSPKQIAGRVRKDHNSIVCHETIYQYIYNVRIDLKQYLRCKKGKYRRRYGTKIREKQRELLKKKRIDTRPSIIEERVRLGDFEGDTIVGTRGTGSLVIHVDRTSRYTFIDYVPFATAEAIKEKTVLQFEKLPKQKRHTITYDNGSEFSAFEWIEKLANVDVYFAYPYHSWERGTNENTNGLIRQFFPKKSSFSHITLSDTKRVEHLLNHRPRKLLGFLTPHEVFIYNMRLT